MRILTSVFSILALTFALGCSGGDDDDDGGGNPADAAVGDTPDAAGGGGPDAMPSGLTSGLGAQCADPSECTAAETDQCLSAPNAPNGNCTLTCGTSQDNTMPPAGGAAACAAAYAGSSGTPECYITVSQTPPFDWYCGVLCGTANGTELGDCPAPLSCTLRAGQTFGDCN